jgi:hypothetical protein
MVLAMGWDDGMLAGNGILYFPVRNERDTNDCYWKVRYKKSRTPMNVIPHHDQSTGWL